VIKKKHFKKTGSKTKIEKNNLRCAAVTSPRVAAAGKAFGRASSSGINSIKLL
jgi:hypothetical protein